MTDLKQEIQELNRLIGEELDLWQMECQCVPGDVITYDIFLMNNYLTATVAFLVEKGIVEEDEFTLYFKQRQLENMREQRPRVKEARLQELQKVLKAPLMHIPKNHKH